MGRQAEKRARQREVRNRAFAGVAAGVEGRPVHVVQVGAHDGKLSDPVFDFFVRDGWRGLLMEPNPVYFKRLEALHEGRETVTLEQVGCSSRSADMTLYYLNPEFEHLYRAAARGCATLDRDRMVAALATETDGKPVPKTHVTSTIVPMRPLDSILADHAIEQTDVLVIDVEGHEPEVLAGCDLARLAAKLAFVEINTRKTRWTIIHTFWDAGYRTFKLAVDLVALSPDYPNREAMAEDLIEFGAVEFLPD